ncbi:MAG: haloacid dehalogenase-like hydrolase [Gemmatimonadota bacterium]|nr:MAG: haloacid dehalogenase-like hydrolase [Gemmatimonadota bacterium]
MHRAILLGLLSFALLPGCSVSEEPLRGTSQDPLPSWSDGPTKQAMTRFVATLTDPNSSGYVAPGKRIAVFDNDGTLWAEQPLYFQLLFALDRVRATASQHPEWREQQPFKAILEGDQEALGHMSEHDIVQIVMATHAGMTVDEFGGHVADWLATARHPRFDQPFTRMAYQPMLELLEYLRANEFKTFIVSGGGIDFMRVFTEDVYGIPPERVVGSVGLTRFELRDGEAVLVKLPEIEFVDDKEGKPVGIGRFIGRRPIAAFGNSDGDLAMLQYTAAGDGPSFMALVHHDDADREWAYDRDSSIGRLDQALDEARERGWTVISMKNDWKRVFPFEP